MRFLSIGAVAAAMIMVFALAPHRQQEREYDRLRGEMVRNQIARRGISDEAVLEAMRAVPRHLFVPDYLRDSAHEDTPLPIGHGQTISQPFIVAYMTETVEPRPDFTVLEIGTGSGYQAAVLAKIVKEVYTIEIIPELGNAAAARLKTLEYNNIKVKVADGYYGWKEHAPYDAIVVTAAAEHIPPPLIEQLTDGGRMIIPVGSPFMVQMLTLVRKENGKTTAESLMPVRFVPFTRSK